MKKKIMIFLISICVFAFMAVGCAPASNEIQKGLNGIQERLSNSLESPDTEENQKEAQETLNGSQEGAQAIQAMMDDLEKETKAVIQEAEALAVPGTDTEKWEAYRAMKEKMENVEDKIDQAEDQVERDYKNGKILEEDYRSMDQKIDTLDDRLEQAEDQLELRLGIDD